MAGVVSNESEVSSGEGTFESCRGWRYTRRERRQAVSRETETGPIRTSTVCFQGIVRE